MEAAPESIIVSKGGARLVISDRVGVPQALDAARLRLACRCAHCTRARIDGTFPERFDGVTITAVSSMGHYGVNVTFSDGHARGIYPWSYLAELLRN
jgi:prepilin-type processing-associated H-X9-DG protein